MTSQHPTPQEIKGAIFRALCRDMEDRADPPMPARSFRLIEQAIREACRHKETDNAD